MGDVPLRARSSRPGCRSRRRFFRALAEDPGEEFEKERRRGAMPSRENASFFRAPDPNADFQLAN
jgi:hypothetical protein